MNFISKHQKPSLNWSGIILFTLGFWLSASLLLDGVIMPSLSATGMMAQESFASVGYTIFGIFNRIELICAGLVLTTVLVFQKDHFWTDQQQHWATGLSIALFAIAILYTYVMTPQLSAWGLELNFPLFNIFNQMPLEMQSLQGFYWVLETFKFIAGATLLRWCYRSSCRVN